MRRSALALIAILALASCDAADSPTTVDPTASLGMDGGAQLTDVIVVFHRNVPDPSGLARGLVGVHGGVLRFTYEHAIKGFAAALPPQAVQALQDNPNIDYIEPDGVVTTVGSGSQDGATWGLDRIDQATGLDGIYSWSQDGTDVHAYVIDTGIRATHNDFGSRVQAGYTAINDGNGTDDCNSHGTHVAGTVGGATWGVAKNVTLYPVRVLNCSGSGTWSQVISGIDWVTASHHSPAVANMSLGGGFALSVNQAVENSIAAGVTYALAAGNESTDACNRSPASAPSGITVGATDSNDNRAWFSNFGSCLDIFAPGVSITSAWNSGDSSFGNKSGTSMAAPHVAGVAALYLDENPGASPAQVTQAIEAAATSGVVGSPGSGSPNLLLFSMFDGDGGDPPPPPTATTVKVTDVAVFTSGNKRKKGIADVTVMDDLGNPVSGATVYGTWSGDYNGDDSGVSGTDGVARIQSPAVKNGSSFSFCIVDVDAAGLTYESGSFDCDSGGGEPPQPPSGSPTDLSVRYKTKGAKANTTLKWSGGAPSVDIYKDGALIDPDVPNEGRWQGEFDGSTNHIWRVCNVGSTTACDEAS